MAWGLEARVPFLDKAFLEEAMNVDAKYKMFSKGSAQQFDSDGKPMMEKVGFSFRHASLALFQHSVAEHAVHSAESLRLLARG